MGGDGERYTNFYEAMDFARWEMGEAILAGEGATDE